MICSYLFSLISDFVFYPIKQDPLPLPLWGLTLVEWDTKGRDDVGEMYGVRRLSSEYQLRHGSVKSRGCLNIGCVYKVFPMIYEQSPKLPNTKICIRWTLVFIKCKKTELSDGTFPNSDTPCWTSWVLISSSARIGDILGLRVERKGQGKEKKRKRKGKRQEEKKKQERKRKRKQKGKEK